MTTVIGGSAPSITFSDSTTQSTAFTGLNQSATPYTTSLGYQALNSNTGTYNVAIGYQSLYANTTASNNTAVGYQAGYSNIVGTGNVYLGQQAGYTATGNNNVMVGYYCGYGLTTGTANTFLGQGSGYLVTSGSKNSILGGYSGNQNGLDIRTSSNNIALSDGDGNPRAIYLSSASTWLFTGNDSTASKYVSAAETIQILGTTSSSTDYGIIFSNTTTSVNTSSFACRFYSKTNSLIAGSITFGNTTTNYATSSDYRLKENVTPMTNALQKVLALNPVTYTWKSDKSNGEGFIAHELAEVCPQAVVGEKDAVDEKGNPQYQGIDTSHLIATLVAAIKELKAEFDSYKATHP
jgi:hypothetical protein